MIKYIISLHPATSVPAFLLVVLGTRTTTLRRRLQPTGRTFEAGRYTPGEKFDSDLECEVAVSGLLHTVFLASLLWGL